MRNQKGKKIGLHMLTAALFFCACHECLHSKNGGERL